jgi:2-C-methyl-D-erythritol 2,4-cyclodiphosphate synthase
MGLALGGLVIDAAPRLHGHSDGDVLLHAIADAILGAAGLGDLGRIFPAGPETPPGVASHHLLAEVVRGARSHGFTIQTVDCTIVGARPRLAARLPEMGARIADLLGIDPSAVNVKASTGNLDGMEGAGRGISATAAVVGTAAVDDR